MMHVFLDSREYDSDKILLISVCGANPKFKEYLFLNPYFKKNLKLYINLYLTQWN